MLSPTLIRRYTPPTCSLEIVAKTSALSQWTGNPAIKELRFELSLDDPRLVNEQKILLTGDQSQLEDLAEAVTDYVQNFLMQTNPVFDFAPTQNIFTYQAHGASNVATIARPQLETKGLLSHRLHLGRLANEVSGQTIQLSATQLYDLANALDSYSADMVALPVLTASRQRQNVMRWGAIAASCLVVIGISKTAWQLNQTKQAEQAAAIANSESTISPKVAAAPLVPPNPHASYSFVPVPASEDPSLNAAKEAPKTADLQQNSPAQSPQKPASPKKSTPKTAAPKAIGIIAASPSITSSPPSPAPLASQFSRTSGVPSVDSAAEAYGDSAAAAPTGSPVQQAEQYFQAQWQSPKDLNETLQYRLTLNPDGKIAKVLAIGKAAELYQNQLTFLALNTAIANTSNRDNLTLRLVLDPDGQVQVFSEDLSK